MTQTEEVQSQLDEANARIAELEEAVQWAISVKSTPEFVKELRSRAFPPKVQEVPVTRYECNYCQNISHELRTTCPCCNGTLFELTGKRTIPIPRKVKRREEIKFPKGFETGTIRLMPGTRYFREWEE